MKKYSAVINGKIIIGVMVALFIVCEVTGLIMLPRKEGIITCVFSFIFVVFLILFVKKHYADYVRISPKEIVHKKCVYNWKDVCITVSCPSINFFSKRFVYRLYFHTDFLKTKQELRIINKKGFFIELNKERLQTILQYYSKEIFILEKSAGQKYLFDMIENHNNKIKGS